MVVEAEKLGSDIIERLAESRRVRHEEATEDLHQDLTIIANVRHNNPTLYSQYFSKTKYCIGVLNPTDPKFCPGRRLFTKKKRGVGEDA